MSYDLLVFEKDKAPSNIEDFLEWWNQESEWSEDHSYEDPKVTTNKLQNWFKDMIKHFPAMNGPHAYEGDDDELEDKLTDYCIGRSLIYSAFAWSEVEGAYSKVVEYAQKHKLGFFNASAEEVEVWVPSEQGDYTKLN